MFRYFNVKDYELVYCEDLLSRSQCSRNKEQKKELIVKQCIWQKYESSGRKLHYSGRLNSVRRTEHITPKLWKHVKGINVMKCVATCDDRIISSPALGPKGKEDSSEEVARSAIPDGTLSEDKSTVRSKRTKCMKGIRHNRISRVLYSMGEKRTQEKHVEKWDCERDKVSTMTKCRSRARPDRISKVLKANGERRQEEKMEVVECKSAEVNKTKKCVEGDRYDRISGESDEAKRGRKSRWVECKRAGLISAKTRVGAERTGQVFKTSMRKMGCARWERKERKEKRWS